MVVTSNSIAVIAVSDAAVLLAEGAVMAGSAGPIIRCGSFVISDILTYTAEIDIRGCSLRLKP